jgi:hypothetical protein
MRILDILQGLGLATAAGIRPFLPALLVGAAATQDLGVDFDATDLAFLEGTWWLLAMVLLTTVTVGLERRLGPDRLEEGALGAALGAVALGLGALLFAGSLADHSETWWPGLPAGIVAALLAQVAIRNLFRRVRGRLDDEAGAALTVYVDGTALLLAALSIAIPPVSVIAVAFLIWLLLGSRRREGEKYAGLRILR